MLPHIAFSRLKKISELAELGAKHAQNLGNILENPKKTHFRGDLQP